MATIQGVYVALFGRPADPTGLAYFNGVTKNGADLSGIGDLASTQEYKDRFAGQSNLAIVNSIYQSLFNRDAESAGLNFFVDALNKGTLNIKNIAIAILDGAQGTDKTIVTNKVTAADNFTKTLDTPVEIAAYTGNAAASAGRAFLAPVGAATSSIPSSAATDAAIVALASTATGGVSLTITDSDSALTTNTDVKYKTTAGDDTITVTDAYTAASKIDGGFGNDTLVLKKLASSIAAADLKANLVNVENVVATSTGATAKLDLSDVSSIKSVTSDASGAKIEFANLASGVQLGVKGAATDVVFGFKELESGTTKIALDKAVISTSLTVTNGANSVAFTTSGDASITKFIDTDVKTVKFSGTGDLVKFTVDATTKITTFDASGLTGKMNVDFTGSTVGTKITGTDNADIIKLAAPGKADTIVYNTTEKSNYGALESIENFKTGEDKIDLKAFNFTKTGLQTLSNITDTAAVFGSSSVAFYHEAGSTDAWVFADSNGNGKLDLGSDFAVKLVGAVAADLNLVAGDFVLSA